MARWWPWALALVAVLNALCYPLLDVGLRSAPPLTFAALRASVAGLALALLVALQRRPLPSEPRTWLLIAAAGLGTTSLGFLGMFDAARLLSPGLATVLTNTQPLVAAVLARAFLRERLSTLQRFGLLLGFLGIVAISLSHLNGTSRATFVQGVAYVGLAVVGVAVGNLSMKAVCERVDPLVATAAQVLIGAIPLAVGAGAFEHSSVIAWSREFIVILVTLGLLATALTNWLWFAALPNVPLSRANAFNFLTPLVGYLIGASQFGERISLSSLLGLTLAAGGVALVQRVAPAAGIGAPR